MSNCLGVYSELGITANLFPEFTGNLSDYRLIIWLMAENDPPWLSALNNWIGRIHISAEFGKYGVPPHQISGFQTTIDYVNGLGGQHGMTVSNNFITGGFRGCDGQSGILVDHQLTADMTEFKFSDSSTISGGTTVVSTDVGDAMMQQRRSGNIDWVVSGDSSHLADHCQGAVSHKQFLCNLWRKP